MTYPSLFLCLKGGLCINDIKSWKHDDDEEAQSTGGKSVDRVPGVQDPLGSSVMISDDT